MIDHDVVVVVDDNDDDNDDDDDDDSIHVNLYKSEGFCLSGLSQTISLMNHCAHY